MHGYVQGLRIPGKRDLCYYPDVNVLSYDASDDRLLAGEDFDRILWRLFRGLRILVALKKFRTSRKSLYVEPWRTCNLMCTYCYARSGPDQLDRLDFDKLRTLVSRYEFGSCFVLGGEPLVDSDYIWRIAGLKLWDSFLVSTNATLLDAEFARRVEASPETQVQVSLEPEEWSSRVRADGRKQSDLLQSKLSLLQRCRFSFRVTIPEDAPYVPIVTFVDRLERLVGESDFAVNYGPVMEGGLPSWIDAWIAETHDVLLSAKAGRYRGKLLGNWLTSSSTGTAPARSIFSDEGFRFFNCDAALGSFSVGPDGRLHGCHVNAAQAAHYDVVSHESDPLLLSEDKALRLVYRWSANMSNDVCASCDLRYLCGGPCFNMVPPNASCIYRRRLLPLILAEISTYESADVPRMISRMETVFEGLRGIVAGIREEVDGERWSRLLSGDMPLDQALDLSVEYC